MKTKILLILMLLCTAFSSCKKDDDSTKSASFNKTSLSLHTDETHQLFQSSNANAISSNRFVASISSSGIVTAEHVGTTSITLGSSRCDVTVNPRYTIYPDPYINWGASKATVKSVCGSPYSEEATGLIYKKTNSTIIMYSFENDKLKGVGVTVSSSLASQLGDFLSERYEVVKLDPDGDIIASYVDGYTMEEITTAVGVQLMNVNYFMVIYTLNNQTRSKSNDLVCNIKELFNRIYESNN